MERMKLRLISITGSMLALATLPKLRAQQDPMYTMYMWNMMTVNPGYAGSADVLNATGLARRQWVGLDGAPTTNSLMVHTPLRDRSLALGLSVVDDRIGTRAGARGTYRGAIGELRALVREGHLPNEVL